MMAAPYSTDIIQFLGSGPIASRPVSLNIYPGTLGLWYATDVGAEQLSVWDGAVWADVAGGTGAVSSVNGATGSVVLTQGDIISAINDETASYTALLADEVVIMDSASANNFTVPPNSSVAFPVGCSLEVWQKGAGQTTIVAGAGVTILYAATYTLKLKEQNSGCSLRKVDTDTWRLIGDMEPL